MNVHPVLLVDRGSNVVLEVIGSDPDVNAAGDFEWLPLLCGYVALFLSFTGGGFGIGLRLGRPGGRLGGSGCLYGVRWFLLHCLFDLSGLLWECFLAKILDDLQCGFAIDLGKGRSIPAIIGTISPIRPSQCVSSGCERRSHGSNIL